MSIMIKYIVKITKKEILWKCRPITWFMQKITILHISYFSFIIIIYLLAMVYFW